ncbi:MAG: PAAR domain-containing protein [Candidatus Acidiferrum sp.]
MPPAARTTDMHVCPMVTVLVPHVGGPILPPCEPTVLIGFLPAARVTDMLTCVGPPDVIIMGSPTVLIGGLMAARIGDPTVHGGAIVLGCFTVMIGEAGVPVLSAPSSPLLLDGGSGAAGGNDKPTAEAADKAVLDKFGADIPETAKTPSAGSATVLQPDSDFKDGLKSRHPGMEKNYDLNSIYGESYQKKIFVNQDKNYAGTLYHEDIHHYSSSAFKKGFGKYKGVKVNEGVTEYFTRQVPSENRAGHYDVETKVAEKIAKGVGEDTLKKAYFQGDAESVQKVKDFLDK